MKRKLSGLAAASFILCAATVSAQQNGSWKWDGPWDIYSGECPYSCTQRKVLFLRAGKAPVRDTFVMSYMDPYGTVMQYAVLGLYYSWHKSTQEIHFSGTADPVRVKRERANAQALAAGTGPLIGRCADRSAAVEIIMNDAANDFLEREMENERKAANSSSGSSGGKNFDANAYNRKLSSDDAAFKRDNVAMLLGRAEEAVSRKDYKSARLNADLAAIVDRTQAVIDMQNRIDTLEKKQKDEQLEKSRKEREAAVNARWLEEKKRREPDRSVLFAGNPGNVPYPNPYDMPDPDKSVGGKIYMWKDSPKDISDLSVLKKECDAAMSSHDGYRLFQLAVRYFDMGTGAAAVSPLLTEACAIARYNRDPWLMVNIADKYRRMRVQDKKATMYLPDPPAAYFRDAYRFSVLRNDPDPLARLEMLDRAFNVLPDMSPEEIGKVMNEIISRNRR